MNRFIKIVLSVFLFVSVFLTGTINAEEEKLPSECTTVEQDPLTGNLFITSENREWLNEIYALKNSGYDYSKSIRFSSGFAIDYNNRWSPVVFESDDEGISGITITHEALLYYEIASGDTVITFPETESFDSFSLEVQDLDACIEVTGNVTVRMDQDNNMVITADDTV